MNRLKDEQQSADTTIATAARVVASVRVPAPPVGAKLRVRARLAERGGSRRAWRLQPVLTAFAVLLLLGSAAFALATVARRWLRRPEPSRAVAMPVPVVRGDAPPVPRSEASNGVDSIDARVAKRIEHPSSPLTKEASEARAREVVAQPHGLRAPMADKPTTRVVRAPLLEEPRASSLEKAAADSQPSSAPEPPRAAEATPELDAMLVLEATRALRRDHDPARATKLLDRYLSQHPDGDLVEEVFALIIEAKSMQEDASAATYAERYLRRFKPGRFREEALRAQRRFAK